MINKECFNPPQKWIMTQTWNNVLFAHWAYPPENIQRLIPDFLAVDTFKDQAWVSIVALYMSEIGKQYFPFRLIPSFPEINVRTYVIHNGIPAVFFISLDASNQLVTYIANRWYNLPYYKAKIVYNKFGETNHFRSARVTTDERRVFLAKYSSSSTPFTAEKDTLEHWLIERYHFACFNRANNKFACGQVFHNPWPLQSAKAEILENTLVSDVNTTPLVHYSEGVKAFFSPIKTKP